MAQLTSADRERFLEQGYLTVPDVVPAEYCDRVIAAMCDFLGVDVEHADSFSRLGIQGHGIVPLHHHQALWDVRQLPALHDAFSFLYGTPKLWVSQDRVSFKVPARLHADGFRMNPVHWDGDPRVLTRATVAMQGLIYLTDTPIEKGPFAMVPSLYRNLEGWLATPRTDAEVRRPDVSAEDLVGVPGGKGTLLVWHRLMPHTSLANHAEAPRLVQYVTMTPALDDASEQRAASVRDCLGKHPPAWALRQRVPGQRDPEPGPAVVLTDLGRRLVGIDSW
jgi:hypothetical protein